MVVVPIMRLFAVKFVSKVEPILESERKRIMHTNESVVKTQN